MYENRNFQIKIKLSNRLFGFFVSFIFIIIFLYPFIFSGEFEIRIWAISLSMFFLIITLIKSEILEPIKNIWLKITKYISHILSISVMAIIFITTVIPVGILMKLAGYDGLKIKLNKDIDTYWIKKSENSLSSLKDQF